MSRRNGAEAEFKLRYQDPETARAVADAVSPDNFQAPEGMEIAVNVEGSTIEIRVTCPKGVGSLISTLDDLMSCLAAAEKTIDSLS